MSLASGKSYSKCCCQKQFCKHKHYISIDKSVVQSNLVISIVYTIVPYASYIIQAHLFQAVIIFTVIIQPSCATKVSSFLSQFLQGPSWLNWLKNQRLAQTGCFKMTKTPFNGGKFCYPWRQKRLLPASIGHFNQHNELFSCQSCFCKKS